MTVIAAEVDTAPELLGRAVVTADGAAVTRTVLVWRVVALFVVVALSLVIVLIVGASAAVVAFTIIGGAVLPVK